MTGLILSSQTLRVMRLVRIAALAGIALFLVIQLLLPATGLAEALDRPTIKQNIAAPACSCAPHPESIS